jgi:folate-binding protein YgfZ
MPVNVMVFDRSPRGLVAVEGPDATSFLQSLLSQDVTPVSVGETVHSLLLHPNGKLDVILRATRITHESWWLDTDPAQAARLAGALGRYRIRVAVDIEDRTAQTGMLSVVGERVAAPEGLLCVPTEWDDVPGVDVIGARSAVAAFREELTRVRPLGTDEDLEALRIACGIPLVGIDVDERTIPQEAFLERNAVSFTKGCFLGQELVCRIDARGHVNRLLRRLRIDGRSVPPAGAELIAGGTVRGTVTSAARVPGEDRVVALAMVRREVEPPAEVVVRWPTGAATAVLIA